LSLNETGYGRLHPLHILQQLGIVGVDDDPLDAERSTLAAAQLVDAGLLPAGSRLQPEDRRGDRFPALASRPAVGLTLLAPEFVEAILDGQHGPELTIERLLRPFPVNWEGQRQA